MLTEISKQSSTAHSQITSLQHTNIPKATEYLLGAGHSTCPQSEWGGVQTCIIMHLHNVLTRLT